MTARELIKDVLRLGGMMVQRQISSIRDPLIIMERQEAVRDYMEAISLRYQLHRSLPPRVSRRKRK